MREEDRPATEQASSRKSAAGGSNSSSSSNVAPSRSHRQQNLEIALIDEFPLRRASTLNLLQTHFRQGTRAFASVAELQAYLSGDSDVPSCVVLCVGGHSVAEAPWADHVSRLAIVLSSTPLVVLSDREEPGEIAAAFRRGARGFIPTNLRPDLATEALRIVLAGGTFVPADVLIRSRRNALAKPVDQANTAGVGGQWPARQMEVLRLLVQGKANKEIARALTMDECKVKIHVGTIMRRLGAANRTEAAILASRLGVTAGHVHDPVSGAIAAEKILPLESRSRPA